MINYGEFEWKCQQCIGGPDGYEHEPAGCTACGYTGVQAAGVMELNYDVRVELFGLIIPGPTRGSFERY